MPVKVIEPDFVDVTVDLAWPGMWDEGISDVSVIVQRVVATGQIAALGYVGRRDEALAQRMFRDALMAYGGTTEEIRKIEVRAVPVHHMRRSRLDLRGARIEDMSPPGTPGGCIPMADPFRFDSEVT